VCIDGHHHDDGKGPGHGGKDPGKDPGKGPGHGGKDYGQQPGGYAKGGGTADYAELLSVTALPATGAGSGYDANGLLLLSVVAVLGVAGLGLRKLSA